MTTEMPPVEHEVSFAGILREQDKFSSPQDAGLTGDLNTAFDKDRRINKCRKSLG